MDTEFLLRGMYAVAILGAGLVGIVTLFTPRLAEKYIFFGATDVDAYVQILGALWLSLGAVAILGILNPWAFLPVLLIQLIYKSSWLLFVGIPSVATGTRDTGLIFFTALFSVWAIALILVIPFKALLST